MTEREKFEAWLKNAGYAPHRTGWEIWQAATASTQEQMAALAAENAALKQSKPSLKAMMSALDAFYADEDVPESAMLIAYNILRGNAETPATDAFLAELRAQARIEGVNFAAARITAAFNHGFIDKPKSEVYDVVKAVLGAKEELVTAPEDGLSGAYAEKALNDWAAELRDGVKS